MKHTATQTLISFLLLFAPFISLASDSLKVKKIEYFEEGKLVRTTFCDSLGNNSKDFYYNYNDYFNREIKNGVVVIQKYSEKKIKSVTTYLFNLDSNNFIFFQGNYIGYIQRAKYDSLGLLKESESESIFLKENYLYRTSSIDSLEFIPVEYKPGFKFQIFHDNLGRMVEKKRIDRPYHRNKTIYKYDSLNRLIEIKHINKPQISSSEIEYYDSNITSTTTVKEQLRVLDNTIIKSFKNENKVETRKEKHIAPIKDYRIIGEPKLTFTQENIYENDRIVKIIYTDHVNNKTKIHQLRYEFY